MATKSPYGVIAAPYLSAAPRLAALPSLAPRPFNPVPPTKPPADISSGLGTPTAPTVTTTGGVTPTRGSSGGGSSAPPVDYMANILNDPIYKQQMAQLAAQGIANAAQRKQSTDQSLITFGEIPNWTDTISGLGLDPNSSMFQNINSDVDAATQQAAAGLTSAGLSTTAKLARGHTTALDSLMSALAARGIVRSGATGVGTNLENQNYLGGQYDARQQLLQYLNGVQKAWAQAEQARQQSSMQAMMDAAMRQIQMGAGGGGGGDGGGGATGPSLVDIAHNLYGSTPYVGPPTGAGGATGVPTPMPKAPTRKVPVLSNPYTTGQKARG